MDLPNLLLAPRIAARQAAAIALRVAQEDELQAKKACERAEAIAVAAEQRVAASRAAALDGGSVEMCMMHESEHRAALREAEKSVHALADARHAATAAAEAVAAARAALAIAHEAVEAARRLGEERAARARTHQERRAADLADDTPRTLKKT